MAYLSHHASVVVVAVVIVVVVGVDGGGGTPPPTPTPSSAWNPPPFSPYNMDVRMLEHWKLGAQARGVDADKRPCFIV